MQTRIEGVAPYFRGQFKESLRMASSNSEQKILEALGKGEGPVKLDALANNNVQLQESTLELSENVQELTDKHAALQSLHARHAELGMRMHHSAHETSNRLAAVQAEASNKIDKLADSLACLVDVTRFAIEGRALPSPIGS